MSEIYRTEKCLGYVLSILLGREFLHKPECNCIAYIPRIQTEHIDAKVIIVASDFFGQTYGTTVSLPQLPLRCIDGVPLLYGLPEIQRRDGRLIVYADIIASTFFLVTRYEEMIRRDVRDEHGRFPGKESLPYRAGFINRPIVDEYAVLLRKWLGEVDVDAPEPDRKFSVLLTHDVDSVRKYRCVLQPLRTAASVMLGRQKPQNLLESLGASFRLKKDPFDTFEEIITLDSAARKQAAPTPVNVAYFFLADGKTEFDSEYRIHSKAAGNAIKIVQQSKATIGLHTSYTAGIHPELISNEKKILEDVCGLPIHCNRHHFLAWREIEDGRALAQAGIDWDTTLGYADVAGFRLGVCRPIPLFDPISIQPFSIEEHPLIVMDCTLSSPKYMNLNEDEAFAVCKGLIDQTRRFNGEFVMLWHNTVLAPERGNYHPKLYRRLLDELSL